MSNQLYWNRRLTTELSKRLPNASQWQVHNQALITQALVFSPDCHLANLATWLGVKGQREHLIQRIRRWLKNERVGQYRCYRPLVYRLFRAWTGRDVNLVLDRTDLGQRWSILLVAAAFGHRALPLGWRLFPFGSSSEQMQLELLKQIAPCLPPREQCRVTLYGDCEFRAVAVQRYCQDQQWHWHLGLKSDTLFQQPQGAWQPLRAIAVERGQRRYFSSVNLTQRHAFGPVNLIADWCHDTDQPRYVVTDLPATSQSWRRGRKRFWIEPLFRDWKSYGFDLERSKLNDPHRLKTLLIGMATATLWLLYLGQWVTRTGRRHLLEADHKRDYSLFRLGRDYACRAHLMDYPLPIGFTVCH